MFGWRNYQHHVLAMPFFHVANMPWNSISPFTRADVYRLMLGCASPRLKNSVATTSMVQLYYAGAQQHQLTAVVVRLSVKEYDVNLPYIPKLQIYFTTDARLRWLPSLFRPIVAEGA